MYYCCESNTSLFQLDVTWNCGFSPFKAFKRLIIYFSIFFQSFLNIFLLLYINLACLFVSNKRQNGWTDRAQFFCRTSRDPREGLWKIKISNICLHQNSIVIKFLKILKIHETFCENPRIIFVLFYDVHKENMFTINLGDGREAPSKASNINFKHKLLVFKP